MKSSMNRSQVELCYSNIEIKRRRGAASASPFFFKVGRRLKGAHRYTKAEMVKPKLTIGEALLDKGDGVADIKKIAMSLVVLLLVASSVFLFLRKLAEPEYKYELVLPENPQRFIQPENSKVQEVAGRLGSVEECYYWVAANVFYVPDYSLGSSDYWLYPSQAIERGRGDCEDFAILLCSLIRAKGVSSEDVRVVAGLVPSNGDIVGHAWVELKYQGKWLALECATRGPQAPPPFDYYLTHTHNEYRRVYWFNDVYYEVL